MPRSGLNGVLLPLGLGVLLPSVVSLLLVVVGTVGCVGVTLRSEHALTGTPRAAYPGTVSIVMEGSPVPGDYEEIAIVTATGSGLDASLPTILSALQREAASLGCNAVIRVRYEDFVGRPRPTVLAALRALGLSPDPAHLAHIGDGRIVLGMSHGLSGNPSRFRDGAITLQSDEAWRAAMPRRDRAVLRAIGLPLLLRYGMARRGSSGPVGSDE